MRNFSRSFRLTAIVVMLLLALIASACSTNSHESNSSFSESDDDTADQGYSDLIAIQSARDLADTWMRNWAPHQMGYSWDSGILMMGFVDLYDHTGDQDYRDYAAAWLDHHLNQGITIAYSDHVPPAFVALRLYDLGDHDPRYIELAQRTWEYISKKASRTSEGGLNHMGWVTGNQIWIDTLFMVTPFLIRYGEMFHEPQAFVEAFRQIDVFRKHLRGPNGLFKHSYNDDTGQVKPTQDIYWGRGNGWIFSAMNLLVSHLSAHDPKRMDYLPDIKRQLTAFKALQDSSGRWRTLLNVPDSYLETSVGPLVAYGLALGMQGGWLDDMGLLKSAIQGAMDQIAQDINDDTLLLGTSLGTSPGDAADYVEVLKAENVSYGIGAFLLAVCAAEHLNRPRDIRESTGDSNEFWVEHPASCEGMQGAVDCGLFYMARGSFDRAKDNFSKALEENPEESIANFCESLIDIVRMVIGIVKKIDDLSLGSIDINEFMEYLAQNSLEKSDTFKWRLAAAISDPDFSVYIERFYIAEYGSAGVGPFEADAGEAWLLMALVDLFKAVEPLAELLDEMPGLNGSFAAALINEPEKTLPFLDEHQAFLLAQILGRLIASIDDLTAMINSIMAETDDQSDDLIKQEWLRLEGDFHIPGFFPPTPIKELLQEMGFDPSCWEGKPWPETLLDMLQKFKTLLTNLQKLLGYGV